MRHSLGVGAVVAALLAAQVHAAATITILANHRDTTFTMELAAHIENTWTHEITEVRGQDLSQWAPRAERLPNKIDSYTPMISEEIGTDGSIEFTGIEWHAVTGFSNGQFAVTLDGNYSEGDVEAMAKARNAFAAGTIAGPVRAPAISNPGALLLGSLGTGLVGWFRQRKVM